MKAKTPPRWLSAALRFSMTHLPAGLQVAGCGFFLTIVAQTADAHIYSSWDGTTGNWTDASRWSCDPRYPNNGQPNTGDTYAVYVSGGTVSRNTAVTVSTLDLSGGGVINGSSTLTVQGAANWSGGAIQNGDVAFNGGLSITSGAWISGSTAQMTLAGTQTTTITGNGVLNLENQSTVINNGTLYARNNNTISESGSGQGNFTNNGTFTRDTGTGTFTVGVTQFHNTGTLNANTGTLNLVHGITNSGPIHIASGAAIQLNSASDFNTGTSFSGAGQLQVLDNEQNFRLSVAIPNPVTLGTAGQISIYDGHTLTLGGALTWSGGTLSRESGFFGGDHGYVNLTGGATIANGSKFYGLTLTNAAGSTATLENNSSLRFNGDAIFQNAGTLTMQPSSIIEPVSGTSGNQFNNSGVLTALHSTGFSSKINVPFVNSGTVSSQDNLFEIANGGSSTGTFHADTGSSITWTSGYGFHAGTAFTGPGSFALLGGTFTFDESFSTSSTIDHYATISLATGLSLTENGYLFFCGNIIGGGAVVANNDMRIGGGNINASTLTNASGSEAEHMDVFFGNTITLNNGGAIQNHGTFLAKDGLGVLNGSGSGNTFVNTGTFTRNTSSGVYTMGARFANTGTVNVETGTLKLTGGGTSTGGAFTVTGPAKTEIACDYTFQSGNTISGDGLFIFGTEAAGSQFVTQTITADVTASAPLVLGNAVMNIAPGVTFSSSGSLNALQSTISGGGTFQANGGSVIGDVAIDGGKLSLGTGDHLFGTARPIVLANGAILSNAGNLVSVEDSGIRSGGGAASVINNSGTIAINSAGKDVPIEVPLNNSGTVSTSAATLEIAAGGTSTGGTWTIPDGSSISFSADYTFEGTTTVNGIGSLDLNAPVITVNGPFTSSAAVNVNGPCNLVVSPMQTATLSGGLALVSGIGVSASIPGKVSGGGTVMASGLYFANGAIDGTTVNNLAGFDARQMVEGSSLTLQNGGIFQNAGQYLAAADASIAQDAALTNVFRNTGTFTRNTSTGIFTVSVPFENTGTVSVETGTLRFCQSLIATGGSFATTPGAITEFSGTSTFDSAAPFTGAGDVHFSGGLHTFLQTAAAESALTISAGEIVLPEGVALNANGIFHGTGGTFSGAGSLNANAGLDLIGAVNLTDATLQVATAQTAVQSGSGALTLNGAATVSNLGTWYAQNEGSISPGTGTGFSFHNSGTLVRDTDIGPFIIAVPFHNSGMVDVRTGTLSLTGGATSTGTYQAVAGATLAITGDTDFSGDSAFTGAGHIKLQSGTQTITDSMSSAAVVDLSGGVLNIAPSQVFQSSGAFHWSGGLITGGGTLENNGTLSLTNGARMLDGATIHNTGSGVASFEGTGSLVLSNAAVLSNDGTLMLLNGGSITAGDASAVTVENAGTVTLDNSGYGLFTISVPFNHSGTFNLNSGAVALNGGGTAENGTFHTQAGAAIYVGNNYTFGPNNVMTGGGATHFSDGSLHVTGSLVTEGSFHWTGGTLDGGGTFTVKGGLNITPGPYGVFINGSTLENAMGSEAVIAGNSATHIVNGGTYRNSGLTRLQGNNNFADDGGGTNRIVNSGTLIRDSGTGYYTVNLPVHNSGNIRSTSGALLLNTGGSSTDGALDADGGDIYLNGGDFEFGGGSLTGSSFIYLSAGTATVTGDTGATSGPATGGFGMVGGTLGGNAMLSVDHGYLSTGSITGSVVLRFTGESTKPNYSMLTMSGGTIRNDGSYSQYYQANYDLDNSDSPGGGTIRNNGTWTMTNGSGFYNTHGGGAIDNAGGFNQAGGGNIVNAAFNNLDGGALNATGGYIYLQGGGSELPGSVLNADGGDIYFNGGTHVMTGGSFTGFTSTYASSGTVNVQGNVGAASGPATGGFGIAGGEVTGTATISADHGYLANGSVSGSVTLRFTGDSTKANYSSLAMSGGTLQNDGAFSQYYQANYDLDSSDAPGGGTVRNNGTWTMTQGSIFANTHGGGSIHNAGAFNQAGGLNGVNASFHNETSGSINSSSGYILLNGGGTQVPGCILNADGGDIYFNGGTHLLSGGTLTGSTFTYATAGIVSIDGDVGAVSGPATGGFGISGGTVTGTATISADHGYFGSGAVSGSPVLRFTGASSKANYTQLTMSGGILQNDGTFSQYYQANYDLDGSDSPGGGTIRNNGSWTMTQGSYFSNTYGGGLISNAGAFNQAGGVNVVNASFHNETGGSMNSSSGYILLQGGGTQMPGSILNADGGDIYFNGGTHLLTGGILTGSTFTYANAGVVSIDGNVGAVSGPATGGFGISGGTVTGTAVISADHGYLAYGNINGSPVIRFTGASSKSDYTHLAMSGGTIRNDGGFSQHYQANYDLDSSDTPGGGTIQNNGTWTLTQSSNFSNSYGGGVFNNAGDLNQAGGDNHIVAAFHNLSGASLNSTVGSIYLQGGGTVEQGSTVNADGGTIYFHGGTHSLTGGTLTGSTFSHVVAGAVSIDGNVGAASGPATGGFGIAGGSVIGTAMISADHGYFAYGNISGSPVLRFTGASSKSDYTHLTMSGGTIRNDGDYSQHYQANWDMDNSSETGGGTIENNGTWTFTESSNLSNSYGGAVFVNHGSLYQNGGANHISAAVINSGTIRANVGSLYLRGGSTHTGALMADSYIALYSGVHTMSGTGASLGGTGAISGDLTLSDGAKLSPGDSPGTLTLYGAVSFIEGGAQPSYLAEIAGPASSDQVWLGDGAALNLGSGLTNLQVALSYAPAYGSSFRIINSNGSGHFTGTFANFPTNGSVSTTTFGGHTYYLQITYGAAGKTADITVITPFQAWAAGKGLFGDDAAFNADPDGDGIANGIEFVLGGEPNPSNPGSNSTSLLPEITVDEYWLRVTYRRTDDSFYLNPGIQYDADLIDSWTDAEADVNGVEIHVTDDGFATGIDRVEVLIPRSNEVAGGLFARLHVEEP